MEDKNKIAIIIAILAAALYSISTPISKLLLTEIPSTLMAALLYLGAGIGMGAVSIVRRRKKDQRKEKGLDSKDMPFVVAMVVLDILAPISLMVGLKYTTAENASLLNNFEIVATSLIAILFFKEKVSKKLGAALFLITTASILLTIDSRESLSFSAGSLLVLLACVFWGFENNCTRKLSLKDPLEVVVIKGFGSGIGALLVSLVIGEKASSLPFIIAALLLGFVAYGLSIYFYISAQRSLGAARTSAYYAVAPFIGVTFSFVLFRDPLSRYFLLALIIMIIGTYLTLE